MLTESKFIELLKKNKQKFLVLGIGGVSMSSIALMLKKLGHEVTGYDANRGAFTEIVEKNGIAVSYSESGIDTDGVCCAVYTAAIKEDSPLIRALREKGIECVVRAEFLGELMKIYKHRIGVSGTHGKSTVSGMISSIFLEAEREPTVMIGAGLKGLVGGFYAGKEDDYIFEACEYRDSFLSFSPTVSVVLNVELDHTDYFKSLEQMENSFVSFMNISADNSGCSIVNYDNENARRCAEASHSKVIYYSVTNPDADVFADNIVYKCGKASFDVIINNLPFAHISLSVIGEFQVSNALAAAACAYHFGISAETVERALLSYTGVSRRFEFRKTLNGAEIRDDYAHHPDEIRATLSAAKKADYKRIYVVYQPHTFSRTHDLFNDFAKAFDDCDEVVFADIYAAREKNVYGVFSKDLANATPHGKYVGGFEEIAEYYRAKLEKDDLLIIMGAGDIVNLEI